MCGIFCLLSQNAEKILLDQWKDFENMIARRGPNSLKTELVLHKKNNILFVSSVLWLQGPEISIQPLKSDISVLNYNGDVFGGPLINEDLKHRRGDTELFFEALENAGDIIQTLSNIYGPYAFVYLNKVNNKLYFGRDMYGRRSLLIGKGANQLIISSVAKRNTGFHFMELPCTGIFSIDLDTQQWQIFPWKRKNKNFVKKMQELETFLEKEIYMDEVKFNETNTFVYPDEIQLEVLDRILHIPTSEILSCLSNSLYLDKILKLENVLENSIKRRILTQPNFCQKCFMDYSCDHAITGVLFSGGVDCAILALLANKFIDETRPIDLINVAFEKEGLYNTPDRLTGLGTLLELQNLCPQRKWNFVEVNVTRQELDMCRSKSISDLIYPLDSILDDSLGCALWFASRAVTHNYTSPCRTLLVGMGADELFGGYTRHRAAFQRNGWKELSDVLDEDWQNLPHRNLGRDDRVVADHGRQLRTPYLDEEVVSFVQGLACWEKTFPTKALPHGIGEKILLRCLAFHLGLRNAATLKKRALQFGSRIANSKEKGHEVSNRLHVCE